MAQMSTSKQQWARQQQQQLSELSEQILTAASREGASEAEVSASIYAGQYVSVRHGEVETVEWSKDRGISLTVYVNGHKGSASTADLSPDSVQATISTACQIARFTAEDPCTGLADADRMATVFPDLDLWHPADLEPDEAIALATEIEAAGFDHDERIDNSDGASVTTGESVSVTANTHGFLQARCSSRHSLSAVMLSSDARGMQRDSWYDSKRCFEDLESAELIGRTAAQRTVARLGARRIRTGASPVLFDPSCARGLVGHVTAALRGARLYRNASFLKGRQGELLFPEFVQMTERPHRPRGLSSTAYDSEGVATADQVLIDSGRIARYILGSYSARRLGLQSTANSGGLWNLEVSGAGSRDEMLERLGTGLLVTELMGQGVSLVTGDYSRGASGFWVEDGQIAHPVEGITIAGQLPAMYAGILAIGADDDGRSATRCGSILIDRMMIAGD